MRVCVTGASGFVGLPLCQALLQAGHSVRAIVRAPKAPAGLFHCEALTGCDLENHADLDRVVGDCDVLVHLAARTHVMHDDQSQAEARYRRANVDVMQSLAQAALRARVKRFVFVSSIKVNGERTQARPFSPDDLPAPEDAYGRSKREAEDVLRGAAGNGMEYVIVRPPLLYGPRMQGNMLRLFRLADRRVPLPIASIQNARDLLYVGSLAELLMVVMWHPAAAGRVLLARDGVSQSTPELFGAISRALGRSPRLLPCPVRLLEGTGRAMGFGPTISRLAGSLQVDDSTTRHDLGWAPSISFDAALAETTRWYRSTIGH